MAPNSSRSASPDDSLSDKPSFWHLMPDPILLKIFSRLDFQSLTMTSAICSSWNRVAKDEILWRNLVRRDFRVPNDVALPNGQISWRLEYRRLFYCIPVMETEELADHTHQVLHVSFSRNGKLFATCSKDGYVLVWDSGYPARIKHYRDMRQFSWKYTQFSQFNEYDTLLLVSGVHCGSTVSGEIAIFSLDENFSLRCRVNNSPYDVFGTWYNANYFISGEVSLLGNYDTGSHLSLVKASQEADSEYRSVMNSMLRFYNRNGSSIRNIMVSNCPEYLEEDSCDGNNVEEEDEAESEEEADQACSMKKRKLGDSGLRRRQVFGFQRGNPMSEKNPRQSLGRGAGNRSVAGPSGPSYETIGGACGSRIGVASVLDDSSIRYSDEYRRAEAMVAPLGDRKFVRSATCPAGNSEKGKPSFRPSHWISSNHYRPTVMWKDDGTAGAACGYFEDEEEGEDEEGFELKVLDSREKYLIFTMGTRAYTPHQIGFKRIRPFAFMHYFDAGPSLAERIAELKMREEAKKLLEEEDGEADEEEDVPHFLSEEEVLEKFDQPDHVIDLNGHIIGMGLSPDERYLYVNCRPWPDASSIENPLEPPPIAEQIDMHVIDMMTLKEVGTMLRSHKAHTANDQCFFIFLDVSDEYVASGAEDKHGYMWDRHYGVCLAKLPHSDVVNSVAFNPADPEMVITASDDFKLKIWRSRNRVKELEIPSVDVKAGIEFRKSP